MAHEIKSDIEVEGKIIKKGGTNSQFLKANGDVDSTAYLPATVFNRTTMGAVPPPGGSTLTKYLREDGTWGIPPGTTYSALPLAEAITGTATTSRLITASVLKQWLEQTQYWTLNAGGQTATIAQTGDVALHAGTGMGITHNGIGGVTFSVTGLPDHSHDWNDVTNKPTAFPPSEHTHSGLTAGTGLNGGTYNGGSSKTFTFDTVWGDARYLTSLPAHSHSWSQITSKPTTFTPSAHTHNWNDITNKPTVVTEETDPTVPSHVKSISTVDIDKWNNYSQDNRVKVLSVHVSQLDTPDEAGLVAFFNSQGFTKDDIDTIIFEIDDTDYTGNPNYEPETVSFMQDGDVNIANTGNVYYSGTAQQITGAQLWSAVDNFIKREKTANRWSKLLCIRPRVGGTALAHAVNLKNPSLYRGTYSGSWVHNGEGSIGNGVNTYMVTGFNPVAAGVTTASAGMSFAWRTDLTSDYRSVMGNYFGATNRFSVYTSNNGLDKGMPICMFDYSDTASRRYPFVQGGILTTSRVGTVINGVVNGVAQTDITNAQGTLPNEEIGEGANYWGTGGSGNYQNIFGGKIGLTACHLGFTPAESAGFANSILQFETDLNRANNW